MNEYKCWCYNCLKDVKEDGWPVTAMRMILCPDCGNKRCPKSTDHNFACTNSNESGQPGSRYE
jgi:DNA-directed RNA polymerase subunit RPC12/RpoP